MNFSNFLKSTEFRESSEFSEFFEFFKFFESEFHESLEFMIMKLESKISMTSIITSIVEFNQSINQSISQSINQSVKQSVNQTFDQSVNQLIEITSANFTYTSKNFIKQNPIKKRKSNDMNEILLFTFNLNRQKISIKFQKTKTAMLKIYVMIKNFHILLIINQINQLLDENTKIVKIDTNIELLAMQTKLNMIIKNQFKLITKFETAKTAQNIKKSQMFNSFKSFQIKSSSHETFKSTILFSNFSSIRSLIIFIVFIITTKHAITSSES